MKDAVTYRLATFGAISFLLMSTIALGANFPMEIIQPQEGLNTNNRFYKAYPAIEYNVRVAVIGGVYPYTFALTTAPSGMSINGGTGEITWANPTASGSPHSVTVQVTDQEGSTDSHSWTITVTTSGFIFVDANADDDGDGSVGSPFNQISDFYRTKYDTTYRYYFVYFRTGTYTWNDCYSESSGGAWYRTPVQGTRKPVVWLEYPGDNAVLDQNDGTLLRFAEDNVYIDGFTYNDMNAFGFQLGHDDNYVIRRIAFNDLAGWTSGGSNSAVIMSLDSNSSNVGDNHVVQDCTMSNVGSAANHCCYMKWYSRNKLLIEDCILSTSNPNQTEGIALKDDVANVWVRNNRITGPNCHAIGGNMNSTYINSGSFEICYNRVLDGYAGGGSLGHSGVVELNQNSDVRNPVYLFRNTFEGRVRARNVDSSDGPFTLYNNVIINVDSGTPSGSHITYYNVTDSSRIIAPIVDEPNGNLVGYPESGIIGADGNLTEAYSAYLGTKGYQYQSGDSDPPAPPEGLEVAPSET